jgi:hypothetical protein
VALFLCRDAIRSESEPTSAEWPSTLSFFVLGDIYVHIKFIRFPAGWSGASSSIKLLDSQAREKYFHSVGTPAAEGGGRSRTRVALLMQMLIEANAKNIRVVQSDAADIRQAA